MLWFNIANRKIPTLHRWINVNHYTSSFDGHYSIATRTWNNQRADDNTWRNCLPFYWVVCIFLFISNEHIWMIIIPLFIYLLYLFVCLFIYILLCGIVQWNSAKCIPWTVIAYALFDMCKFICMHNGAKLNIQAHCKHFALYM